MPNYCGGYTLPAGRVPPTCDGDFIATRECL
jgi:hypothetical protein